MPELRAKYSGTLNGSASEKAISLTFDDGPDLRFTPQVLDVLKRYGVKATFFLIGTKAKEHPDIVKRIVKEGHAIGNHSFSHPLFTKLDMNRFSQEIEQTEDVLQALTGSRPKLIRPPYGVINEEQLLWVQARGMTVVNWNVDSLDWKSLGEAEVSNNILGHTNAGAIVRSIPVARNHRI
jgi:peptidoglycan/xylan/chitin deacetylase (PgdA/CDA1 family)